MNSTKGRFNQNIILAVAKPLYSTKHHDPKHSWGHIKRVREDLVKYVCDFNLEDEIANTLFTALVFHDCNMKSKENHHRNSANLFARLVKKEAFLNVEGDFTEDDKEFTQTWLELNLDFIYQCIFEHRSSVNAKRKSELGYITSLLDFGYPFPLKHALDKALRRGYDIVKRDYKESGMVFDDKDNFDWILCEGHRWFKKRWLNQELPRDITKEDQKELLKTYNKNMLAKALVDMLYDY